MQLSDFHTLPAETGQIEHPALVLLLKKLDGERLGERFEGCIGSGIFEHGFVRLEANTMVGDVLPSVVHVNMQLGTREQFKSSSRKLAYSGSPEKLSEETEQERGSGQSSGGTVCRILGAGL